MNGELHRLSREPKCLLAWVVSVAGLAMVFMFQHVDFLNWVSAVQFHPYTHFIVNKSIRVILNDLFMLVIIFCWFRKKKITKLAFYIQLFDMLILLPVYFWVKLWVEGDSEISHPLLSQFHRLIVNPTLMILFIPAVYFQRIKSA